MASNDFENGVWRTIGGRRVFIREGQSLSDAMKKSGKFKSAKKKNNTFMEQAKLVDKRDKGEITEKDYFDETAKLYGQDPNEARKEVLKRLEELGVEKPEYLTKEGQKEHFAGEELYDDNPNRFGDKLKQYNEKMAKEQNESAKRVEERYKKEQKSIEGNKSPGQKTADLIKESGVKTFADEIKEQNKYEGTKRWGFGYANDDNVPVYDGKIDYSGDFTHANLSNLTDNELREALNKQSELYKEASNRQVGDRRTYNGKKDEIFKKTDTLRYENGMKKINEEMEKRDLPRYNIYNKDNGQIMVSSPTKEMAERQLKEMYETDKSLQKSYNWEKTPKYEIREGKVDDNLNERKENNNQITNTLRRKAYQKYLKEHPASKISFEDFKDMRNIK